MNEEQPIPCVLLPFPGPRENRRMSPDRLTELILRDLDSDIRDYGPHRIAWVMVDGRDAEKRIIDYDIDEDGTPPELCEEEQGSTIIRLTLGELRRLVGVQAKS